MKKYTRILLTFFILLIMLAVFSVTALGAGTQTGVMDTDYAREKADLLDKRVFDHYGKKGGEGLSDAIEKTQNVVLDFDNELNRAATKSEENIEIYIDDPRCWRCGSIGAGLGAARGGGVCYHSCRGRC